MSREHGVVYTLTICNGYYFDTVVRSVAIGMSFIHVSKSIQLTRTVNLLANLASVWDLNVIMFVLKVIAINLQKVRELLQEKQ